MELTVEESKIEKLDKLIATFAEENELDIKFGNINKNNIISLTVHNSVDTGDKDISAMQYIKWQMADKKYDLTEKGLKIGMLVKGEGSAKPRSREKACVDYKIVSAIPSAKEKVIETIRLDTEKTVKFAIEDIQFWITTPIDQEAVDIMNAEREAKKKK